MSLNCLSLPSEALGVRDRQDDPDDGVGGDSKGDGEGDPDGEGKDSGDGKDSGEGKDPSEPTTGLFN